MEYEAPGLHANFWSPAVWYDGRRLPATLAFVTSGVIFRDGFDYPALPCRLGYEAMLGDDGREGLRRIFGLGSYCPRGSPRGHFLVISGNTHRLQFCGQSKMQLRRAQHTRLRVGGSFSQSHIPARGYCFVDTASRSRRRSRPGIFRGNGSPRHQRLILRAVCKDDWLSSYSFTEPIDRDRDCGVEIDIASFTCGTHG